MNKTTIAELNRRLKNVYEIFNEKYNKVSEVILILHENDGQLWSIQPQFSTTDIFLSEMYNKSGVIVYFSDIFYAIVKTIADKQGLQLEWNNTRSRAWGIKLH